MGQDSILPAPNGETELFWRQAALNIIELPYCEPCDVLVYYPAAYCPNCLNRLSSSRRLSNRGKLHSWTQVHVQALPGQRGALPIAEVVLGPHSELVVAMNMSDKLVHEAKLDIPVVVSFVKKSDTIWLPIAVTVSEHADLEGGKA